jgi:Peptidase family S41
MSIDIGFTKKIVVVISTFLYVLAQLRGQDCNCEKNLNIAVSKVTDSYAGFRDKVKNKRRYEKFKDSLIIEARSISDFFNCYRLLLCYTDFFKDPHLGVRLQSDPSFRYLFQQTFQHINNSHIDIDSLYSKMKERGMDSLEGIWTDYSEIRKILISKVDSGSYTGYIYKGDSLYWYKGQTRFHIAFEPFISTAVYYKDDRVKRKLNAYLKSNLIYIQGYEYLTKDGSGALPDESTNFQLIQNSEVGVLKIPDLSGWNWPTIDSVVGSNLANIRNCRLLVIDFRDNGGGGYGALKKLYPYIFTRKVPNDKYWIKSSQDNINDFKKMLDEGTYLDTSLKKMIASRIRILEKNKGRLCEITNENLFEIGEMEADPPRIAFLINEETSSAAEMFVKIARENSQKVKVYGKNSYGVMDYGHVARYDLDYKVFKILIPKSKSHWVDKIQYDYKGIVPDIRVPIQTSDWIEFVMKAEKLK